LRYTRIGLTRSYTRPSLVLRKDVLQELILKELKTYKPAVETKKIESSQIKDFRVPKSPTPPVVDKDVSAELAMYDAEDLENDLEDDDLEEGEEGEGEEEEGEEEEGEKARNH